MTASSPSPFPPDAFYHAAKSDADFSAIRYVVVTHSHIDHFYAGDFILRGYKYAKNMSADRLEIYANAETLEVYRESTRRELKPEVGEYISLHEIRTFEPFSCGEWTIHPLKAKHSSREPMVFLLEKGGKRVLHLHDTGPLPEDSYAYLAQIGGSAYDLITFDCTFLFDSANENARHMGLDDNLEILRRLKALGLADEHTKSVITHFSHNAMPTPERLERAEAEYGVVAAFDGMLLEI